ncbi:MAG TPA: tetratricopeptide repeat protein, partial [Ferruginibacter sp.]|nr:tetratricopeptide repeat protein [Ferruginibacter sp.]
MFSCKEKNVDNRDETEFSKVWEEATIIHDAGDVAGSLKYIDSMYRSMKPEDKHDQYSYYYFFYNAHRRDYRDHNKALLYSDSMIMVFGNDKSKKNAEPLSQGYSSKGDALLSLGKYDDAFNAYYEGRIYAGTSENTCALGDHDYRLGMVLYKQERYAKAADYFKSAKN